MYTNTFTTHKVLIMVTGKQLTYLSVVIMLLLSYITYRVRVARQGMEMNARLEQLLLVISRSLLFEYVSPAWPASKEVRNPDF